LITWRDDKEKWKFQKIKQKRLISMMYLLEKMDDPLFIAMVDYLKSIKGMRRDEIIKEANRFVEHYGDKKNDKDQENEKDQDNENIEEGNEDKDFENIEGYKNSAEIEKERNERKIKQEESDKIKDIRCKQIIDALK